MVAKFRTASGSMFPRRLIILAVLDQSCPLRPHRGVFLDAVAVRDDDDRRQPEPLRGQCDRLPVIAPRCRNQAARLGRALYQFFHVHDRGAGLERACRGLVFMFHPDLRAETLAQERPAVLRRRLHHTVHRVGSLSHLVNRQQCRCHFCPHPPSLVNLNAAILSHWSRKRMPGRQARALSNPSNLALAFSFAGVSSLSIRAGLVRLIGEARRQPGGGYGEAAHTFTTAYLHRGNRPGRARPRRGRLPPQSSWLCRDKNGARYAPHDRSSGMAGLAGAGLRLPWSFRTPVPVRVGLAVRGLSRRIGLTFSQTEGRRNFPRESARQRANWSRNPTPRVAFAGRRDCRPRSDEASKSSTRRSAEPSKHAADTTPNSPRAFLCFHRGKILPRLVPANGYRRWQD